MYYQKSYATLTAAEENDFTTEAIQLLEQGALAIIYRDIIKDPNKQATAEASEFRQLSNLRRKTARLLRSGKLGGSF